MALSDQGYFGKREDKVLNEQPNIKSKLLKDNGGNYHKTLYFIYIYYTSCDNRTAAKQLQLPIINVFNKLS